MNAAVMFLLFWCGFVASSPVPPSTSTLLRSEVPLVRESKVVAISRPRSRPSAYIINSGVPQTEDGIKQFVAEEAVFSRPKLLYVKGLFPRPNMESPVSQDLMYEQRSNYFPIEISPPVRGEIVHRDERVMRMVEKLYEMVVNSRRTPLEHPIQTEEFGVGEIEDGPVPMVLAV